jgi:hypothetical protein
MGSLLTRGNVSCCHALVYVTCQPCAALASHVEKLWCCDGHPGVNGKDRALPDGRFQLAFSLADGPISALADPMGDGGGIAPSLLIGIQRVGNLPTSPGDVNGEEKGIAHLWIDGCQRRTTEGCCRSLHLRSMPNNANTARSFAGEVAYTEKIFGTSTRSRQ